jgi:hypothetical protein
MDNQRVERDGDQHTTGRRGPGPSSTIECTVTYRSVRGFGGTFDVSITVANTGFRDLTDARLTSATR